MCGLEHSGFRRSNRLRTTIFRKVCSVAEAVLMKQLSELIELPDEPETPVRTPLLALMPPEETPEKVEEPPRPHSMFHGCLRQAHV